MKRRVIPIHDLSRPKFDDCVACTNRRSPDVCVACDSGEMFEPEPEDMDFNTDNDYGAFDDIDGY